MKNKAQFAPQGNEDKEIEHLEIDCAACPPTDINKQEHVRQFLGYLNGIFQRLNTKQHFCKQEMQKETFM